MLPANDLFLEDSIEKRLSIVSDDETINLTNEDIHSEQFQLKESICSEQSLKFGSCEANSIEFTIANTVPAMTGKWLTVTITPYNRNGTAGTAMTLGRFKVFSDKPSADREKRTVIAYDKLFYVCKKNYRRWYRRTVFSGHTTLTVKQFRDAFFTKIGITQDTVTLPNDGVSIKKAKVPSKLTGKDILTAICEINGVFGHIGRDNNFKYLSLSTNTSPTAIGKTYTISVEYSDNTLPAVDRIEMLGKDGEIVASVGSGEDDYTNKYTIDNNFIVNGMLSKSHYESALQTLSLRTALFSLVPLTAEMKGHPRYEVGDRITYSVGNTTKTSFILNRTMKGIQDLRDTYDSMIEEYYSNEPNAVNTKTAQMQSMEYQIGAMEDMTEVHLEKLDDGSVVVRDENLASDEEDGSWNTKVFWCWSQNDLIVNYQHTWSIYDICIKCDYPFLVCDFPYAGGGTGTPRTADIGGTNYTESAVYLVVRTPKNDPAPNWKELNTFHEGNREQSRQIGNRFLSNAVWGEWAEGEGGIPVYVGDYTYYYRTWQAGSTYSGLYGMCRPDKHYPSYDAFFAALRAGEINPPNTRKGDVILPTGKTQKESADALKELANTVSGDSGSGNDPNTQMQVEPDSTTDVESENNQKSVADSLNQIKNGISSWIGSIVNHGRGDVVATVKKRDDTTATEIKASTNLTFVEPRAPLSSHVDYKHGDIWCRMGNTAGWNLNEETDHLYTEYFDVTTDGFQLRGDSDYESGAAETGGYIIYKMTGLTVGKNYTFTYKANATKYTQGVASNPSYDYSLGYRWGHFGVWYTTSPSLDPSVLPLMETTNTWHSDLLWQNFADLTTNWTSYTNTFAAVASTMYVCILLDPLIKGDDHSITVKVEDFKTSDSVFEIVGFWAKYNDDWFPLYMGEGTVDYNGLENRPQINSVTLTGNKTTRDLGMIEEITQAAYDLLPQADKNNPDKVYYIKDAGGSGGGGGGGSTVTVTPILTEGVPIATITVNGTEYTLYAPQGGGGSRIINENAWNVLGQSDVAENSIAENTSAEVV